MECFMKDETLSAKKKIQIALVTFAVLWALLTIIYIFGGFDRWAIGIYWYDLNRFIEFLYHKAVAPVGAFCIAFKFLLYLVTDDEEGESKISKRMKDLKYEQSRIEGMVDKNRDKSHNASNQP
jgi:hypothetical protein